MAGRKAQHDAEYFPFYAKDGRTLFMLQARFGLEGIGFFTNLLRLLCTTPHHHLNLSNPIEAPYTWAKIGLIDEAMAEEIMGLLVATGKIDRGLWEDFKVIYSQDFVDSLSELYAGRKEKPWTIEQIREIYAIVSREIPIVSLEIPRQSQEMPISGTVNTQRKERKGKEVKEEPTVLPAIFEDEPFQPDDLYASVWGAFISVTPRFSNYQKEGTCTKALIKSIRNLSPDDPMGAGRKILEKYLELTRGREKMYSGQPFTPSGLYPHVDRVWALCEKDRFGQETFQEAFDGLQDIPF